MLCIYVYLRTQLYDSRRIDSETTQSLGRLEVILVRHNRLYGRNVYEEEPYYNL